VLGSWTKALGAQAGTYKDTPGIAPGSPYTRNFWIYSTVENNQLHKNREDACYPAGTYTVTDQLKHDGEKYPWSFELKVRH